MTKEQFNKMVQHDIDFYVAQGEKLAKESEEVRKDVQKAVDRLAKSYTKGEASNG